MVNKRLGTQFEKDFCRALAHEGFWVHFIAPDARGAQPFDVIAVKNGEAFAFDCKTSVTRRFNASRIEDNQHMAFERWMSCGNSRPMFAILHNNNVYLIAYNDFDVVILDDNDIWIEGFEAYMERIKGGKHDL